MDLLTGSLILNIIFFLIIIFKNSLNDIVKNWWQNSQQSKKERQEHLLDLREVLEEYKDTFGKLSMIAYAISTNNKPWQGILNKQSIPKHNQNAFASIKRYIGLLPVDLQNAYKEVINKAALKSVEILYSKGTYTQQEFNETKLSIEQEFNSSINLIDDYLKKH